MPTPTEDGWYLWEHPTLGWRYVEVSHWRYPEPRPGLWFSPMDGTYARRVEGYGRWGQKIDRLMREGENYAHCVLCGGLLTCCQCTHHVVCSEVIEQGQSLDDLARVWAPLAIEMRKRATERVQNADAG